MPPHNGHVGLCRAALRLCDQLTVLVCSRDIEPIPGRLRAMWMAELLPGARVVHMHRDIPQEPKDHHDFWAIWRNAVAEHHPEPVDRVFGSEAYIVKLAAELGAEPVLIDPQRIAFPVSGTMVRENPVANWAHIPGEVRPWYQKRVVTFGPESVGKTTLALKLGETFGGFHVPEYGRVYDQYRGRGPWTADDFLRISEGHVAVREAVARNAGPILIEDTDPLLTAVWARMLRGESLPALEAETRLADLYLLLDIDVPWRDDGTRYFDGEDRERFMMLCRELLARREARFVSVSGDWDKRLMTSEQAVEELLAEPFRGQWATSAATGLSV